MQKKFPLDMFDPSEFWYVSVGNSHMFSCVLLLFQGILITSRRLKIAATPGEKVLVD